MCVIGALAPEKASVVMLDVLTVAGSRCLAEVTICPSAPQSIIAGLDLLRVDVLTSSDASGGFGGGCRSGGGLTQSENPGCQLAFGSTACLPQSDPLRRLVCSCAVVCQPRVLVSVAPVHVSFAADAT